jgi:Uma2 family endonuclease
MTGIVLPPREAYRDLPNDGRRRWIVNGQIKDWGYEDPESEKVGMTVRNQIHSFLMADLTTDLNVWLRTQPQPRGRITCGEAGIRLPGQDTTLGVDVAYIPHEVVAAQDGSSTVTVGVPQLVVEILSPSDTLEMTDEMVELYLSAGVPRVWIISPRRRELTVYRTDGPAKLYLSGDTLTDDLFPGLSLPLSRVFV